VNMRMQIPAKPMTAPHLASESFGILRRKCACGGAGGSTGECAECKKKKLQRRATGSGPESVPPIVHEVLRSPGQPLDAQTRAFFEPRFGHDFSKVRVHAGARADESAQAVHALAYTVGQDVVFATGQYASESREGKHLLAHELTHTLQQPASTALQPRLAIEEESSPHEQNADATADAVMTNRRVPSMVNAPPGVQRRAAPYIKKVTVHLSPSQSAELAWEGSAPDDAPGSDQFMVSTGKGYSDPGDEPGTCTRSCCNDANTQCAPPWNQPGRVGACCTYFGNSFWTGTPLDEHNTWKWWTPIEPYYSSRGIALHAHDTVTGQPIGHGCVRMDEPNAKRIHDFSNGRRTNVTIDGRAAPVLCDDSRKCGAPTPSGAQGENEGPAPATAVASNAPQAIPGLEGVMS
jgi:Domain of unknown function (DUF4157)